jgi:SAM-dependent methyltransferase
MVKKIIKVLRGLNRPKLKLTIGSENESARVEWLRETLSNVPRDGRILDAGAGEQQFKGLCSHLQYVSQDFAMYKPEELDKGLQVNKWDYGNLDIISDIASIPEPNESFDAIMCTEVFEHIINPREAIIEFTRLLRKGGYLIITAPFCSLTHFAPYHFYTGFSKYFYETELNSNNFEILEVTANGNYFEFIAQELIRLKEVALKYSNTELTRPEMKNIKNILVMLQKITEKDKGSSELLTFGYHVLARKK